MYDLSIKISTEKLFFNLLRYNLFQYKIYTLEFFGEKIIYLQIPLKNKIQNRLRLLWEQYILSPKNAHDTCKFKI